MKFDTFPCPGCGEIERRQAGQPEVETFIHTTISRLLFKMRRT